MEINKIYNGDCYELIKQMPDKCVDLIYTDPPYLYESGFGDRLQEEGKITNETRNHIKQMSCGVSEELLDQFVRVMKYIYIYIWCNDKQIIQYMNYFVNKHNCDYKILVWRKENPMPMYSKRYLDDVEYCLFFVEKGKQKFCGTDTYNNSFKCYSSPINVIDKEKYKHSSVKPYQVVKNHLEKTCSKGMLVLDAFLGSGTVACVCKDLGLNYIGFEKEEKWFKVAQDRLNGINQKGEMDLISMSNEEEKHEQLDLFGEN